MARREKSYVILRERTRAERREEIAVLLLGGAYSLAIWAAIGLQLGRLVATIAQSE